MIIYKVRFNAIPPVIEKYEVLAEKRTYKVGPKQYVEKNNCYATLEEAQKRVYDYCIKQLNWINENTNPLLKYKELYEQELSK